jgi:hypothetical protein
VLFCGGVTPSGECAGTLCKTLGESAIIARRERGIVQETIDKLKNFGSGAHAHTANKCAYYIEVSVNQKKPSITAKLIELANRSMASGDWKELRDYMSRWW